MKKMQLAGLEKKVEAALNVIRRFGQTDGGHHKAWVIDQVVRELTGDDYNEWVIDYVNCGEYYWDTGIAP